MNPDGSRTCANWSAREILRRRIIVGGDGIVYPSVRNPGGECIAAFWPDVIAKPVQGRHFRYHWDGERIDMIHELILDGSGQIFRLEV